MCFRAWAMLLILSVSSVLSAQKAVPTAVGSDLLLNTMGRELNRAMSELKKADPPPYFLSYTATDQSLTIITAMDGSLVSSNQARRRMADIQVRVGSPALDNTHNEHRSSALNSVLLPLNDDVDAIARVLWRSTDRGYEKAVQSYLQVKTNSAVLAKEEDDSSDFSTEKALQSGAPAAPTPNIDVHRWEQKAREYSAIFKKYPEIYSSSVYLMIERDERRIVSSEGTKVLSPDMQVRIVAMGETRADDGMELVRAETVEAEALEGLPADSVVEGKIEKLATDLKDLRRAPVTEPFAGPALFSGRATAVFFHEVLGHRLEGQRQRGDREGQTFTKQLNRKVLPDFISVSDNPTLRTLGGTQLNGYYDVDDEGQPARNVELVKSGVLTNFLMSRLPVKEFQHSNGHGRAQVGLMPTGRQGNLIVSSAKTVEESELRNLLIAEAKKQGKPYGLRFEQISGGSTLTTRSAPQVFQVEPVMVYRIYTDGRPDELVRGVNIVGTPLAVLSRIAITGNRTEIFNGQCGAESGFIPVSAAAPAMLISEIEVERQRQGDSRPPILQPPGSERAPIERSAQ